MPVKAQEMNALDVRNITKQGRHAVGSVPGLLLVVKDTGSKSWVLRTIVGDRRRSIGLGGYPAITLANARDRARRVREMIEQGIDPIEDKQSRRRALKRRQANTMTFQEAARLCHEKKSSEYRNAKHSRDWISSINQYATPIIGDMPVNEIELTDILAILEPIWQEKTETATRLRQRIESVIAWATVSGYRKGDNPARWKGHLDAILPKPSKIKKVRHLPALPWKDMKPFMADLRHRNGMAARALEFIILTAVRSGEARKATWDEIDFENRIWTIPAHRMKGNKEHRVPLSEDALIILESLPRFKGSTFVFTAARGGPLSDMAISMVCRRMQINAVPHGFRSTFRDWCGEFTNTPREVAEEALAHINTNKVEAAYRRGDMLDKRRKLMDRWATYCRPDTGAVLVPLRKAT